jgi:hypothetical protein
MNKTYKQLSVFMVVLLSLVVSSASAASAANGVLHPEGSSLYAYKPTGKSKYMAPENPLDDIEIDYDLVDEEAIQEQNNKIEDDEENPPPLYTPLSDRGVEQEVEESSQEQREGFSQSASFWIGQSKPYTGFGLSYSLYESPGMMHNMYLGSGRSGYSNTNNGYSYKTDFDTFAAGYDYAIFPFKRAPIRFSAGFELVMLDGDLKDVNALDGSFNDQSGSYTSQMAIIYGTVGFIKTLYKGFYFGIDLLTVAKPFAFAGEDNEISDEIQKELNDTLTDLRYIPPLNITFGYLF